MKATHIADVDDYGDESRELLTSLIDPGMANNTGNPEGIRRLLLVSDPRLDEVSETA